MTVATLTLNPAVDQTVRVDNLKVNAVNRSQAMQFDAGGKGVNVASFLADFGVDVAVTGFLGRENPDIFEALFAAKGISDHFVRFPGRTRTNVKVVDEAQQQTTDINSRGLAPPAEAYERLNAVVDKLADRCDWLVLAGNLPPGAPTDVYARLIARIRAHDCRVALDTSGAALRAGVAATPDLVKPNVEELEQLVGHALTSKTAVQQAAQELVAGGITLVAVSDGDKGATFFTAGETIHARPPMVNVKSTVGAGDALVAGLIAGELAALDLAGRARLATAFALGNVTRVGAHLPDREELENFVDQVEASTLDLGNN